MKVFLTGGTGLLGSNIAEELLEQKHEVTALVRSIDKGKKKLNPGAVLVEGDILKIADCEEEMAGAEVLIHAAACYSEFYKEGKGQVTIDTNVNGTVALLEAAYRQGIRNAVYISSSGVLSWGKNRLIDETAAYDETTDPYFRSKIDAEKAVFRFLEDHPAMRIVLLLPSVMLGPNDWGPTPTGNLMLNILKGEMKIVLPGSNRIVDARDVARAAVAAIDNGDSGERYLVGGNDYTFSEIYQTLGEVAGITVATKKPPTAILMLVARLMAVVSKITGKQFPLKPGIVKRLSSNFRYDSSKAQCLLGTGFRPLRETLTDMVAWFKKEGHQF
ncbi:MAG: NAD-dependent epimerase/dehydratase family protein [bacterium]|nr:NAD-dependent epimerase/dehydratase family protein [bacterium]